MKSLSFFVILFFIALITACSKKADDSSSVTPGTDSLRLTNTQLIAKSWKYQTVDVVLPDGTTVNLFTRGATNNANVRIAGISLSLDKSGSYQGYQDSYPDLIEIGTWGFTNNESKIVITGGISETRTITQLTYYHWDYKLIYDSTTPNVYFIDDAKAKKVDLSKGATFSVKMVPN